jgi:hypothetical protein
MEQFDHRGQAVETYNQSWSLLERDDRSPEQDRDLLTTAFTSRFHWRAAGGVEQWVMSDWMVARAAAAVGEGRLAVDFALAAHDAAQRGEVADWLLASCAEGVARAYAALGDEVSRDRWSEVARSLISDIIDDEDRELIASQLDTIPR